MIDNKDSKHILNILPLYFIYSFFNVFISKITNIPLLLTNLLFVFRILLYLYIVYTLLKIIKKLDYKIIFLVLLILCFMIISRLVFLNSGVPNRFNEYVYFIMSTLIPLTIAIYYSDENKLIERLAMVGYILGFIYIVLGFLALKGIVLLPSYDMSMGYCVIIPMSCLLYKILKNLKRTNILMIISLIGYIIFTVVFASRGPLVGLGILFCYLLFFLKDKFNIIVKILLILIIIVVMFFYTPILSFSSNLLNKVGIRSRTIELIINKDIYHSSGRENLYSVIIEKIKTNPFAIRGISSETMITYKNQYAHNMYLEILYQFGCFIGLPFLIIISVLIFKDLNPSKLNTKPLISIFLIISVVTLQFSSSVWLYSNFWLWLSLHLKNYKLKE